ncbi:unnamed protein product [Gadus morhua 'NCC']
MEEKKSEERDGDCVPTGESPENGVESRDKWANKSEFLLSMAGEIIGLGNVWRFPYLCYKNGGGVFFIPYFVFLFFCGIPLFFLETAMGQYTSEGGVTAWRKMCPMFQGIGYASQVIVLYLNVYYIVVLAWAIFYLFNSFWPTLPWSTCENAWNTVLCYDHRSDEDLRSDEDPSWGWPNGSMQDYDEDSTRFINATVSFPLKRTPEEEFWMFRVSGAAGWSGLHWEMVGCLLLAWVLCYLCVFKGIRSTGKVVYFTATFPYLMLILLFLRGVTLPGAMTGITYYLYPDLSRITDPTVWRDAGTQVFFSYAVCQGVLTALGSYNKYNNDCYRDTYALCCLNSATSIFAGFAVFSIMGFMAQSLGVDMADIMSGGPGLVFIAYPKALSMLPVSNLWAVLFFLMILFLGLDSQFVCVESLATAITDLFPGQLRRKGRRELLVLGIAVVCFLLGLPFLTEGGLLLFQIVDTYGPSGVSLLFIASFQCAVIGWVYGADRFMDNIEDMIGYRPFPVLKYCWMFVTPLICMVTMVFELESGAFTVDPQYTMGTAMSFIGSLLVALPLLCVAVFVGVAAVKDPDRLTTPCSSLRQARPQRPLLSLCKRVIFRAQAAPPAAAEDKMAMDGVSGV